MSSVDGKEKKMFRVEIHENVHRLVSFLLYMGFWHRQDKETSGERTLKLFYSTYPWLLAVSIYVAVFTSESMNDSIFLIEAGTINSMLVTKLLLLIWHKKEILELLQLIGGFCAGDLQTFVIVNNKLENFMKFAALFLSVSYIAGMGFASISSFIGTERTLFLPIAFPMDWRHDELAFWLAFSFFFTGISIAAVSNFFTVTIWYLMANCSWRYEVLGNQMKKIGKVRTAVNESIQIISKNEQDHVFNQDMVETFMSYNYLNEYIKDQYYER